MSLNEIRMPKDSQGREIPLSTETMYFLDGRKAKVSAFEYWPYWYRWEVKVFGYDKHFLASDLLLFPPDSWEQLEHDATLAPRDYLQARGIEERKDGRIATMMLDLVSRAKALAEREKRND